MKRVSPLRTLSILLYIGGMMCIVMLMSPGEVVIKGDWKIKIPKAKDVLPAGLSKYLPEEDSIFIENETLVVQDTAKDIVPVDGYDILNEVADYEAAVITGETKDEKAIKVSTRPGDVAVEYPKEGKGSLDAFFKGLESVSKQGKLIRVLHYGDSQLEGDRMTERLRRNLQEQFGGCGVGLAPILYPRNTRSSMEQMASDTWEQYLVFGPDKYRGHRPEYGYFGKYFMFEGEEATLTFEKTPYASRREKQFEVVRLYMKNPNSAVTVEASLDGKNPVKVEVPASSKPKSVKIPIKGMLGELQMKIHDPDSADYYAVSFDCHGSGVAVDNIPMRGSSGTEFVRNSRTHMADHLDDVNVKLVILQFGVNVVPQIHESYGFYERNLTRQIRYLKSVLPNASIMVVSVSDMAKKEGTEIVSYENIDLIRAAQRRAAYQAGAVYWDLYLAMGGKGSIINWSEKGWANSDYTHFSRKGANFVGDMLYNELMREYQRYKQRKKTH